MLEAPGDETSENHTTRGTLVPPDESQDLLVLCVPLAADEHERRRDTSLEDSREYSGGREPAHRGRGGGAGSGNSPAEEGDCEVFANWEALEEVDCTV
jgi:hypothetical protein